MNKNSGTNKEKWFPVKWNENILCPSTLFIERKFNVWIRLKVNSFFGEITNEKRERGVFNFAWSFFMQVSVAFYQLVATYLYSYTVNMAQ